MNDGWYALLSFTGIGVFVVAVTHYWHRHELRRDRVREAKRTALDRVERD